MPDQKKEILSRDEWVEEICSLIKWRKKDALEELISENISLNIMNSKGYSAIRLLAKDNDFNSVRWLINSFKARRNHALFGAAWGGHKEQVKQFIAEGASPDWAVAGAAYADDLEYVNELIVEYGADLNWAVAGAAHAQNLIMLNGLLAEGADIRYAMTGAGMTGDIDFIKQLLRDQKQKEDPELFTFALLGACAVGNQKLINTLSGGENTEEYVSYIQVLGGRNVFDGLFQWNRQQYILALGAAVVGGQIDFVNILLAIDGEGISKWEKLNAVLAAAAVNQDFDLMNKFIEQGADYDIAIKAMKSVKAIRGHEKRTLHQMAFLDSPFLRSGIAEVASKENNLLDQDKLIETATKLNQLMKKEKINFDQALRKVEGKERERDERIINKWVQHNLLSNNLYRLIFGASAQKILEDKEDLLDKKAIELRTFTH